MVKRVKKLSEILRKASLKERASLFLGVIIGGFIFYVLPSGGVEEFFISIFVSLLAMVFAVYILYLIFDFFDK